MKPDPPVDPNDTTLIRRRDGAPVRVAVHDRFKARGHKWAVTETTTEFEYYRVTHVETGAAVNFVIEDSPEDAVSAFFDQIDNYTDREITNLVGKFDPIKETRECPHCNGTGYVKITPESNE